MLHQWSAPPVSCPAFRTDGKKTEESKRGREDREGEWGKKNLGEEVEKVNVEIEGEIGSGQRSEREKNRDREGEKFD